MPNKHFCQNPKCHENTSMGRFQKSTGRLTLNLSSTINWPLGDKRLLLFSRLSILMERFFEYGGSAKIKSNSDPCCLGSLFRGRLWVKSCLITRISQLPEYPVWQRRIFVFSISRADLSFSTKITLLAFLLNASNPIAPVPAKRSRTFAWLTRSPSILKSASRARSEVGRIVSVCPAGATSFLPLAVPLIIRKAALREEWVVGC